MIVTDDDHLADEARIYRDQGKGSFLGGGHVRLGSAWRMSEVHAAIGRVHLDRLDAFIAVRRRVAEHYDRALADLAGATPVAEPPGSVGNVYKYPVLLDAGIDQGSVGARLAQRGISLSGKVYAVPLHREAVFSALGDSMPTGGLAGAEEVCARHICLPVHSDMTDVETAQVAAALRSALAERS